MPVTKFFEYSQNNSGGSFDKDDAKGIGPRVWIEAENAEQADSLAEQIGLYFDGVSMGVDCSCCGDRWRTACDDGEEKPTLNEYSFYWHDTVYVHHIGGRIERIAKPLAEAAE